MLPNSSSRWIILSFVVCWATCLAATITAADPPQVVRVASGFDKAAFSYRIELDGDHETFHVYRLTYPSPVQSPLAQNNTIPAELYLPKGIKPGSQPRPAVICLHILGGGFELTRLQCTALAARGIPAIWFKLPYYAERGGTARSARLGRRPAAVFPSPGPRGPGRPPHG